LGGFAISALHGFPCYDITAPNAKCQRMLVLSLYVSLFFENDNFCMCVLLSSYCVICDSRSRFQQGR